MDGTVREPREASRRRRYRGGSDIAVVYYNPGALALMENPEILLMSFTSSKASRMSRSASSTRSAPAGAFTGVFWTDFNAITEGDTVANVSGSPFGLYHFGGGYSFDVGSSDVTLGGVVALGSAETTVGLRPPALDSELLRTSYLRVTFIVGFNFALATGG